MLPQFGFSELLLVAVIALIVVGPKDLPLMMRKLGQFVARGRAMANEFRAAFDDIARQAELDELRQEIESLKRENAVSEAAADLKAVEQDINRTVMESGSSTGSRPDADPAELPDETDTSGGGHAEAGSPADPDPETETAEGERDPGPKT